jgi:hypothetical protein
VGVFANNGCGTFTLPLIVKVSDRFYEVGTYQNHTYFRTPYPASWQQADSMARSIGANLVAINSSDEDYFLSRAVPDTMRAWIGMNKEGGQWHWSNGDAYRIDDPNYFHNWCPGQPDNWLTGQDYGLIHSHGVPVGTDACWDDGHSPTVPGSGYINNYFAIVESNPVKCTDTIVVTASTTTPTNNPADKICLGYGPQTDTLNAIATGIGAITYSWSGDALSMLSCTKCANPEFKPIMAGNYSFTVTTIDRTGCITTSTRSICVKDIRERDSRGVLTGNIWVCHKANNTSMAVSPSNANGHIGHGDDLGKCGQACGSTARLMPAGTQEGEISVVQIYPNPTHNAFFVEVPQTEEVATVTLLEIQGKVIDSRKVNANDSRKVRFDLENNARGLYVIEVAYGETRFRGKIVRQ